mmetsp:Transcript_32228/g.80708  ORF Transcript_32228/g.80708 Transcript_32228/m.80708 type:complete len:466 (-) Transcript_32228:397-1794(-)
MRPRELAHHLAHRLLHGLVEIVHVDQEALQEVAHVGCVVRGRHLRESLQRGAGGDAVAVIAVVQALAQLGVDRPAGRVPHLHTDAAQQTGHDMARRESGVGVVVLLQALMQHREKVVAAKQRGRLFRRDEPPPEECRSRGDGLEPDGGGCFAGHPHTRWEDHCQHQVDARHALKGASPLLVLQQPVQQPEQIYPHRRVFLRAAHALLQHRQHERHHALQGGGLDGPHQSAHHVSVRGAGRPGGVALADLDQQRLRKVANERGAVLEAAYCGQASQHLVGALAQLLVLLVRLELQQHAEQRQAYLHGLGPGDFDEVCGGSKELLLHGQVVEAADVLARKGAGGALQHCAWDVVCSGHSGPPRRRGVQQPRKHHQAAGHLAHSLLRLPQVVQRQWQQHLNVDLATEDVHTGQDALRDRRLVVANGRAQRRNQQVCVVGCLAAGKDESHVQQASACVSGAGTPIPHIL